MPPNNLHGVQMEIIIYQSTTIAERFAFTQGTQPDGAWRLVGVYKEGEQRAGLPTREILMRELAEPDVAYVTGNSEIGLRRVLIPPT